MGRNVVIHEHMGDPAGYAIAYVVERHFFKVTRLCDGVVIGVYATRVTAIAAAQADRTQHDE